MASLNSIINIRLAGTIVVAGGYDVLHEGHIESMIRARALGDRLKVITHPDEVLIRKKGYCQLPLRDRISILRSLRFVDDVIVSDMADWESGTVANTLKILKPNIFAKGGDRTPDNMPQSEIDACNEIGCQIVYGVGEKLGSSSDYFHDAIAQYRGAP